MTVSPIQLDITSDESINRRFKRTEENLCELDILINNAGTPGQDLARVASLHQKYDHCFSTIVASAAILTEAMTLSLEKSKLANMIFITTRLGSLARVLQLNVQLAPVPTQSCKSATNMLYAFYARIYPGSKVNTVCPGLNATRLNGIEKTEETDPEHGAIRAVQPVLEGPAGVTGRYSETGRQLPWPTHPDRARTIATCFLKSVH